MYYVSAARDLQNIAIWILEITTFVLDPDVPVITQADWERVAPFVTCWSKGELSWQT